MYLNIASHLTGIARHASRYSTEDDCKLNDAFALYFSIKALLAAMFLDDENDEHRQ